METGSLMYSISRLISIYLIMPLLIILLRDKIESF